MKNKIIILGLSCVIAFLFACKEEEPEKRTSWPTAEITSIKSGSFYLIGDEIEIAVNANDPFGEVARVDILVDNTTITSLTAAPYEYTWDTKDQTKGAKTLSAIVYGEDDEKTTTNKQIEFLSNVYDTVSDYDGNIYKTVVIGEQRWIAENLRSTHYADGTPLVDGFGVGDITGDYNTKYYFYYESDSTINEEYGVAYTWAAIMNVEASSASVPSGVQGICPTGYHVPSDEEWKILERYCGMSIELSNSLSYTVKRTGNNIQELSFDGTLGFKAVSSVIRYDNGDFLPDYSRCFWTSTQSYSDDSSAYNRSLYINDESLREIELKNNAFSIRCIKN